jgi:hypothetical protein
VLGVRKTALHPLAARSRYTRWGACQRRPGGEVVAVSAGPLVACARVSFQPPSTGSSCRG